MGQNHRFLEGDNLVAQSGSAWTDTAQGAWDDSVFRDINNELSSYGKSRIVGRRQQLPEGWAAGDPVCDTQSVSFCITKCLCMEKTLK